MRASQHHQQCTRSQGPLYYSEEPHGEQCSMAIGRPLPHFWFPGTRAKPPCQALAVGVCQSWRQWRGVWVCQLVQWVGSLTLTLPWQESMEQTLQQCLIKEQFALLQGSAREAERMVQDALSRLEDPAHISCTGSAGELLSAHQSQHVPNSGLAKATLPNFFWDSPATERCCAVLCSSLVSCVPADYLLSRTLAASECTERLQDAHRKYLSNHTGETRQRWGRA